METDICLSYRGGGIITDDGDLKLTQDLDALSREVSRIVRTVNPAWKIYPNIGAGLEVFVGEPNTRGTALEITKRLNYVLNQNQIAYPGRLFARVVPSGDESLFVFIFLKDSKGTILIDKEVFNFTDGVAGHIYDPSEVKEIVPNTRHAEPENPYLK